MRLTTATLILALATTPATAADSWPMRSYDLQRTGDAGFDGALTKGVVRHLGVTGLLATEGTVAATPVVSASGLLVTGDDSGRVYVFDTTNGKRLASLVTGDGSGSLPAADPVTPWEAQPGPAGALQSTPAIGRINLPGGGTNERAYVAVNAADTLWCLDLDAIAAARGALDDADATAFVCDGPEGLWPMGLVPAGATPVMNGALTLATGQKIDVDENGSADPGEVRDVLFVPTAGTGCDDGALLAIDAWSGETYWTFDPVPGGAGGTIWTTPAMNADRSRLYVTTASCAGAPAGGLADSVVALDAATGAVVWHHRRHLADPLGVGIGSGVAVADVSRFLNRTRPEGCRVVVSSDRDGCILGFAQAADVPAPGEPGWDPLRPGEQRVLWRRCFVPGSPNGGFNASNPAFSKTWAAQQTSGAAGHVGLDDSNAFAVDVCTGVVEWSSSSVGNGQVDGAIVNQLLFQASTSRAADGTALAELAVVELDEEFKTTPNHYASVALPHAPTPGGGGPAIVMGKVYVPTEAGIVVLAVVPNSNGSGPQARGNEIFAGSYPAPISPSVAATIPADTNYAPHAVNEELRRLEAYQD